MLSNPNSSRGPFSVLKTTRTEKYYRMRKCEKGVPRITHGMNWRYLTFSSSSRGILSSSNSNSSSVISTPNLKRIAVSISHPSSSHLGHPYPQYPKHMAAINALLLLQSSRSRAPREYQRLIRVLIPSAFSKKEILPQNPCIGGAQK